VTTLHVARPDELDLSTLYAILRLRSEVFIVEQACPYQDVDGRDLDGATRHLWLTGAGPAPLAYLRILDEAGAARIGRVCVSPDARRQGLAGTLLGAALGVIGERESVLDAQAYATDLYTAAGFVADGPEFVEDGIPHVPMRHVPTSHVPTSHVPTSHVPIRQVPGTH
jgi:ElaA protein